MTLSLRRNGPPLSQGQKPQLKPRRTWRTFHRIHTTASAPWPEGRAYHSHLTVLRGEDEGPQDARGAEEEAGAQRGGGPPQDHSINRSDRAGTTAADSSLLCPLPSTASAPSQALPGGSVWVGHIGGDRSSRMERLFLAPLAGPAPELS